MNVLKDLERIDVKDLYVGEIFHPQVFTVDKNGKNDGGVKAVSLNKFEVATRNEQGDFVSIIDGTVYSEGSTEKIINGKYKGKMFFWNRESFAKVTGKKGKITQRAAIKEAKAINLERTQGLEL